MAAPAALFAPVSGPGGSGEYYRCLAIARALQARCPELDIHFLIHQEVSLERDERFHYHPIPDSPTKSVGEVVEALRRIRPSLVLFDSAGRMTQFRAARRVGAKLAWLSDRPNKRWKGFRWRMMALLDLHLMAASGQANPRLGLLERFKLRFFPRLRTRFFSGIAPAPDADRRRALCQAHDLPESDYVILAPGGGGYTHQGRPVPEIMLDAASRIHEQTGLACVMVMGPQYRGDSHEHETVRVIDSLPTEDLTQLLHGARLAVIGAGSMMTAQTLSLEVPAVIVPAGGDDQPPRIADFSRRGLATAASMDEQSITDAAVALAQDPDRQRQQQQAVHAVGIRNDVVDVAKTLQALIEKHA
ncbi:UDP:flavonoid glycosyltransferase YjiC (YdhE family) [Natronospira proteinivora]|uniref:UDP:flavonoid glycosyltransferase YjiC (YdhE family) n=1 Tax=Natronospira proteinivora TaxID=1807133 RepID=A0ABT1GBC2_9GAMM|nr:hypothetical protein [Natronospira proteinivora]MCP1728621.1 UDP:flavonoid glycosyltransferase YjiC (YdhE family) [Natronospira proteinivora]